MNSSPLQADSGYCVLEYTEYGKRSSDGVATLQPIPLGTGYPFLIKRNGKYSDEDNPIT